MHSRWLGKLLRGVHAGETHSVSNHPSLCLSPFSLSVESDWFDDGGFMPERAAGKGVGSNISPPLTWSGLPAETAEVAIIVEDPDAPLPRPFIHLVAYGIPAELTFVPEDFLSASGQQLRLGRNTTGSMGYMGPRPVPGHGPHRYHFHVLALDRKVEFAAPPKLKPFLSKLSGAVVARGTLTGVYERQ